MARRIVSKETTKKLSKAQTSKECMVSGCEGGGRTIGRLGDIELNYCGHHRKYGERVLNFLINSVFGFKLTDFLKETKHDLFMQNIPKLSDESYELLGSYVNTKIEMLDEVNECYKKTKH